LNASMSITTNDASKENIDGWTFPGPWTSYRLYPGGKVYYSQTIAAYPQNVNLEPDPEINPLGIFHRPGTIQLSHNVKIQGTVVANGGGDVYITGRNVHLSPVDLPPLEGTSEPIQLPVLMPEDDFRIYPGAQGSVEGMLAMRDDFEIVSDEQYDINVPIEGRIVCRDLMIRGRTDWQRWDDNVWDMAWDWLENLEAILDPGEVFMMGMGDGRTVILAENDVVYFPVLVWGWLDLDPNPRLTIKPPSSPARYHWHDPNNPVYVPHPDDDGLRWDLLEWAENP